VNERTRVPSRPIRRRGHLAAVFAALGATVLLLAAPGAVHAENAVVESTPADGERLATPPPSISITFAEPLGDVNTIAVQCARNLFTVGPRTVSEDRLTLSAEIVDQLPAGQCTVSWGVSNAAGQPNGAGNLSFTIENETAPVETTTPAGTTPLPTETGGTATATAPGNGDVAQLSDVEAGQGPLWLGRLISVLGVAVVFGSLVVIAAAWPEGVEYLLTVRFLRAAWLVALVGTLLYVVAATAAVTGAGFGDGLNPMNWFDLFSAGLPGIAALARLVFVVASAWVAFRPDRVIDPVTQLAALLIPGLAVVTIGLSRTNMDLAMLAVPLSIVHALAMAVWVGGVVLLARVVLAGPGEEDLVHAVRGFGRISTSAIVITIVTGVIQMILLDGGNLFGSAHGRVVLLKTVVVAFMIFVAVSARQYVNSRLPRATEMSIPTADRLRRAFGAEAAAGLLVLALSAWLLSLSPPNVDAAGDAEYAIELRVVSEEADLEVTVKLTADQVGLSGMVVEVIEPESGLSGLEVVLTAPPNDEIGTITQPVPLTGPGIAVLPEASGVPLTVAGDWTVAVNAVTPNGVFTSDPQIFTVTAADGSVPAPAPTPPPAATVTVTTAPPADG
jgi:copper transport protein